MEILLFLPMFYPTCMYFLLGDQTQFLPAKASKIWVHLWNLMKKSDKKEHRWRSTKNKSSRLWRKKLGTWDCFFCADTSLEKWKNETANWGPGEWPFTHHASAIFVYTFDDSKQQ